MHIFSHISSFLNLIFCLFFRCRYFIILSFTLSICSDFISHLFKIILLFMYFNPFLAIFFQQKRDTSLKEASLTLYLPTTASQSDVRPLFSGVPWKGEPDGETRATQL